MCVRSGVPALCVETEPVGKVVDPRENAVWGVCVPGLSWVDFVMGGEVVDWAVRAVEIKVSGVTCVSGGSEPVGKAVDSWLKAVV